MCGLCVIRFGTRARGLCVVCNACGHRIGHRADGLPGRHFVTIINGDAKPQVVGERRREGCIHGVWVTHSHVVAHAEIGDKVPVHDWSPVLCFEKQAVLFL